MLGATIARQRAQDALLTAKDTLELRVEERTRELQEQITAKEKAMEELAAAQSSLLEVSRAAGMAEVATGVLHNVGNVLNSVNVSCTLLIEKIAQSKVEGVSRMAELLAEQKDDLARFFAEDSQGNAGPGLFELPGDRAEGRTKGDALRVRIAQGPYRPYQGNRFDAAKLRPRIRSQRDPASGPAHGGRPQAQRRCAGAARHRDRQAIRAGPLDHRRQEQGPANSAEPDQQCQVRLHGKRRGKDGRIAHFEKTAPTASECKSPTMEKALLRKIWTAYSSMGSPPASPATASACTAALWPLGNSTAV